MRQPLEASSTDAGLGPPPMILGRSLSKVPTLGLNPLAANPAEALRAITRHSQLEVYRDQSKSILKTRAEATSLERGLWAAERHRQNETVHLDEMLVKLANIATRVKKSRFEDVRHDLVDRRPRHGRDDGRPVAGAREEARRREDERSRPNLVDQFSREAQARRVVERQRGREDGAR